MTAEADNVYGLMAEFDDAASLCRAARALRDKGYQRFDAFTPHPVEGLDEAIGVRPTRLPRIVLVAAVIGGLTGFGMQYFASVIHYPINVGGRPLNSWPAFIPITFELTILFAATAAVVAMIARNGLPRPYHPVFNARRFERASQDKFFVCIEVEDPLFDRDETQRVLEELGATEVNDVAR